MRLIVNLKMRIWSNIIYVNLLNLGTRLIKINVNLLNLGTMLIKINVNLLNLWMRLIVWINCDRFLIMNLKKRIQNKNKYCKLLKEIIVPINCDWFLTMNLKKRIQNKDNHSKFLKEIYLHQKINNLIRYLTSK